MKTDFEIYDGKTLSNLFKDIVKNSEGNKKNINKLIVLLSGFVKNRDDAVLLLPAIKEFLEVDVKNDEQLVKLAGIVQRLLSGEKAAQAGLITDQERNTLLKIINIESKKLQESSQSINDEIEGLPYN